MFLANSVPPLLAPENLHPALWCAFMGPYFFLELKIYGQWLSGGKRRLCKVANPSSHLSVVGNFVRAILASKVGWKEAAKLWAVGFAHYLVVFVTLYQRLPTSEPLPKELHPVYSMFIAAPSPASIAWETIYGDFDGLSRTYVSTFSQGSGKTTPMLNFLSRFPISFRPSLTCGLSFVTSQVFSGIVVLYLPHDNSISDNNQVRRECPWCSKQGPCTCTFFHVINDGGGIACIHPSARFCLAHIISQWCCRCRCHCHEKEKTRQGKETLRGSLWYIAMGKAGSYQAQFGKQGF